MAMYCKAQSRNWQLQLNQTGLAICVQVFNWPTTARKVAVIAENTMSKSKTVLEMIAAGLDAPWKTTTSLMHSMTAWSSLAHSILMRCWDRRDQPCMFCTPSIAVFSTHFSQQDLNPANLEATVEAEWILAFLFFGQHFSMTSQLRSVVQVLMGHFTIVQSHGLSGWFVPKITKSCLNLSKLW